MHEFKELKSLLGTLHRLSFALSGNIVGFQRAVGIYFGEEHMTFKHKMFHNLDKLQWQLDRKNLHECDPKTCLEVLKTQFENLFAPKKVNASDYDKQCLQKYFKECTGMEPHAYRHKLLYEVDEVGKIIDGRVLYDEELWMKEREVKAIRKIEKRLTKSEMQTEEEIVTEGIALDGSLVSRERTNDNTTSSKQQDESTNSRYDADAKKVLVDTVASDIENADIGASYDTYTGGTSFKQ
ncbi:hypothetical protein Tco_1205583 [Tanacetum coccineum]